MTKGKENKEKIALKNAWIKKFVLKKQIVFFLLIVF